MATSALKPLALVTGASSGIGLELAKVFAREGHDLVVAADNRAKLDAASQQIRSGAPAARIEIVTVDLANPDGPFLLYEAVQRLGRDLDVLVNNAGVGVWGEFARQTNLDAELDMIQLNVASVVALTKLFVRDMIPRRTGKILFTASEASLAPTAYLAAYGATKAFEYSFALSLREELKDTGITVTALLPGATDTNFFHRAGAAKNKTAQGRLADPATVARDGYDALMRGDDHVVTPMTNKLKAAAAKLLPDEMKVQRVE
jgi:uncharacterized protein